MTRGSVWARRYCEVLFEVEAVDADSRAAALGLPLSSVRPAPDTAGAADGFGPEHALSPQASSNRRNGGGNGDAAGYGGGGDLAAGYSYSRSSYSGVTSPGGYM